MTRIQALQRYIPLSIILVSISTISGYLESGSGLPIANTVVWWVLQAFVLYLFFCGKYFFCDRSQTQLMIWVKLYLWWNIFSIIRGVFIAETYWDWKGLAGNGMALLIPVAAYVASNTTLMQSIILSYIKFAIPLFFIFAFIITKDSYGFYLVPVSFVVLFFSVLSLQQKIFIASFSIFILVVDLDARSNVIKFGMPFALSLIFYFRLLVPGNFFKWSSKFLFALPIILFYLAISSTFNVFNMDEYIEGTYTTAGVNSKGEAVDSNLLVDTRTFLYREVLETAMIYDSWWIGRSPARGNISVHFGNEDLSGRGERLGNEVALLNVFTWTGIVGVFLFSMAFFHASSLAISQSNNVFSKILGLFIAFRWAYSWVEDINYFTLTTVFLWLMIGLCYSTSFRGMTNQDVAYWINGVFCRRYIFSWHL